MARKVKSIRMSLLREVNVDTAKKFFKLIAWDCPSDYECLGEYELECIGRKDDIDCFKCWERAINEYISNEGVKDV